MALRLLVALLGVVAADPAIPFSRFTLQNGLTVIVAEDHRLPLVAVEVWYRASPACEPPGRSGFAHLFEHMMFKGSAHLRDGEHVRLLERAGVTQWNATTDFDRTTYYETVPAEQLPLALWLEAERMGHLVEGITDETLRSEREVVRNERRETVEDTPYGRSEEALVQALFPGDHPYHANVIGSHADLEAATVGDVARFHRAFYTPRNATLVIAGDVEPGGARALIEKFFAPLDGGSPQPRRDAERAPPAARRIVVAEAVSLPRVWMGWVTAPAFAARDAELDLAVRVLGGGRASRLWRRLVHERGLASEARCGRQPLALGSPVECWATPAKGVDPATLERALEVEVARLRDQPPTADELARARRGLLADQVRSLEQLGGQGGKSDVLAFYQHYLGDPGRLPEDLSRYRAVTPESLRAAAAAELDGGHAITVVTTPRVGP